jgi:hypothetical protein
MSNISLQYPAWYIILCVLLGLGYALALYFRERRFDEQATWLKWLMAGLRALAVTLLSVLLLSPLLKAVLNETKKPVLVFAQDESESVAMGLKDSAAYHQKMRQLTSGLSDKYDVKTYSFGEKVREGIDFKYKDKTSNLSQVLADLTDLYAGQNLGAVVMASDGIYNEGANPIYAGDKLGAPVFTIALGDTIPKKDLVLKRVFYNKIAYLGDKFSVQADISAQNCPGNTSTLIVSKVQDDGSLLRKQQLPLSIDKNEFFTTRELILDADQAGVQHYRVSLAKVNGETTTLNNEQDIFVDVLDARQKILLLAQAPHPDLAAIKDALSKNKNYQFTIAYIDRFTEPLANYDFVVLHQLPGDKNDASAIIKTLDDRKIAHLFIIGSQSDVQKANQVQQLVGMSGNTRNLNDAQATFDSNFNLFILDDRAKKALPNFPPLTTPFGDFRAAPNAKVLLYQKIGKVETKYPLLAIGEQNGTKVGVLCGEGLWRWRMFDYLQHQNHALFDDLIEKVVQYLTIKEDKRKFRVSVGKNVYNENEPIYFDAELYNQSYELINTPDASLTVTNQQGKDFPFSFSKVGKGYSLNAGFFPPGNYRYKGVVNFNGEQLTNEGQFSVRPIQVEVFETTANHALLRGMSRQLGGRTLSPNELDSLPSYLAANDSLKPILYSSTKTTPIINIKWLFFILLGLLSLEWFARRYFGGY